MLSFLSRVRSRIHCHLDNSAAGLSTARMDGWWRLRSKYKTALTNMGLQAGFTNQADITSKWKQSLSTSVAWGRPSAEVGKFSFPFSRLHWQGWQLHGKTHMGVTALEGGHTFPITFNSGPEFPHITQTNNNQTNKHTVAAKHTTYSHDFLHGEKSLHILMRTLLLKLQTKIRCRNSLFWQNKFQTGLLNNGIHCIAHIGVSGTSLKTHTQTEDNLDNTNTSGDKPTDNNGDNPNIYTHQEAG